MGLWTSSNMLSHNPLNHLKLVENIAIALGHKRMPLFSVLVSADAFVPEALVYSFISSIFFCFCMSVSIFTSSLRCLFCGKWEIRRLCVCVCVRHDFNVVIVSNTSYGLNISISPVRMQIKWFMQLVLNAVPILCCCCCCDCWPPDLEIYRSV